jgi:hypothetical protein
MSLANSSNNFDWSQVFGVPSAKFQDKDHFVQGDAAVEIFDTWYKYAAQYAKGQLNGGE